MAVTKSIHPSLVSALRLLGNHTRFTFILWHLAGPDRSHIRAAIMSELLGCKMPKAKCGINAMRKEFYAALPPVGECEADREGDFSAKARELLREHPPVSDFPA